MDWDRAATDSRQAFTRHRISQQLCTGTLGGETMVACVCNCILVCKCVQKLTISRKTVLKCGTSVTEK